MNWWVWVLVVVFALWLAGIGLYALDDWLKRSRPCAHGIKGARRDSRLCPECNSANIARQAEIEAKRRENEERRRADAQRKEIEVQQRKQRAYDEYLRRLRLPEYLKRMDSRAFEFLVCDLYRRLGYDVKETPATGDGGIDGFLRRNGQLYLLQCKRTRGSVGEPVLHALLGCMTAHNAVGGIVVTTGKVSEPAKRWATGKPIEIVEFERLQQMIEASYTENEIVPSDFEAAPDADAAEGWCPLCHYPLRIRRGPNGWRVNAGGIRIEGDLLKCTNQQCTFEKRLPRKRS
jgi:hypothetical protein